MYEVASVLSVATSELMLARSERTVVALLFVLVGRADERVETRRRGRMLLMSCILAVRVLLLFAWNLFKMNDFWMRLIFTDEIENLSGLSLGFYTLRRF